MAQTMTALVKAEAAAGLTRATVPRPVCGRGDVLIRVLKTGICGTDVHIYGWDEWASRRVRPPFILGHEFMGVVADAGDAVTGFQTGDLVSAEGHIGCGHCFFCRTGQGHICRQVKIIGVDCDGCFAEYLRMPETNVWKLKPGIPDEVAAIFDPYGNAMHTVMAQAVAGKTLAIIGAGAIGLMAVKIASAAGALAVFVIEPRPAKREMALSFGAQAAFDPAAEDWKRRFLEATPESIGVDIVLEMSGHPSALRNAFELVRPGGEVALLGIPASEVGLNIAESIIFKSVTVRGINGRLMFETWYQCERFLVDHKLDLSALITHRFPFGDFERAFDVLRRGEGVKVILNWG